MNNSIKHYMIKKNSYFPNNQKIPLLLYQGSFKLDDLTPELIENTLKTNGWKNIWRDSIFSFHHYHSNTHEVLVIYSGSCTVEIGGENGKLLNINKGDTLIIPAGVSHKNSESSQDFKCIGAYPFSTEYNMNYGNLDELPKANLENKEYPPA